MDLLIFGVLGGLRKKEGKNDGRKERDMFLDSCRPEESLAREKNLVPALGRGQANTVDRNIFQNGKRKTFRREQKKHAFGAVLHV